MTKVEAEITALASALQAVNRAMHITKHNVRDQEALQLIRGILANMVAKKATEDMEEQTTHMQRIALTDYDS